MLVQARVVDGQGGLGGHGQADVDRLLRDRPARVEREELDRSQQLGRRGDRQHDRRRALLEKRDEQLVGGEPGGRIGIEHDRLARQELAAGQGVERLRPGEDGAERLAEIDVRDVQSPRDERLATGVRHADDGGVDLEQLDDGSRHRVQRRLQRETLGEGT
jgi:hypothetical protein